MSELQVLTLTGPRTGNDTFWQSRARLQLAPGVAGDKRTFEFRRVFLTDQRVPVDSKPSNNEYVPRTLAARVGIDSAKLFCAGLQGAPLKWKAADGASPVDVVAQSDATAWKDYFKGEMPPVTLVDGRIPLDELALDMGAPPPWERMFSGVVTGALQNPALSSSGLAFHAGVVLPWMPASFVADAPWIVVAGSDAAVDRPNWQVTLDRILLTADQRVRLRSAFRQLAEVLQPRASTSNKEPRPRWASLEMNTGEDGIPEFYWRPIGWIQEGGQRKLRWEFVLKSGTTRLVLNGAGSNPAEVTTAEVETIVRPAAGGAPLTLAFGRGQAPPLARLGTAAYTATPAGLDWDETWVFKNVTTGYDAISVAAWLRGRQARAVDIPARREFDPASEPPPDPTFSAEPLWGFMPLEEGWAQLPFLNLTDEVYADVDMTSATEVIAEVTNVLSAPVFLDNAVRGYDQLRREGGRPFRTPFSVGLLAAQGAEGQLELAPTATGFRYGNVSITLARSELTLEGFLHLAAAAPTAADALPDGESWATSLASIPLRTSRADPQGPFPSPQHLTFERLEIRRAGSDASLQQWSMRMTDAPTTMLALTKCVPVPAMLTRDVVPTFVPVAPLLWLRHPSLPAVQALPLTQSAQPPASPSASRQLAPFALPVAAASPARPRGLVPANQPWSFDTSNQANRPADAVWPRAQSASALPAPEWQRHDAALPLAMLSLPGVAGVPSGTSIIHDSGFLTLVYRHDLPALDEVNALAALPRDEEDPLESPLIVRAEPEPARANALSRDDLSAWWSSLAERARLGTADAVEGIDHANNTDVHNLVEPYEWPVRATFDARWPGCLTLTDQAPTQRTMQLAASTDPIAFTALRGLHGTFRLTGKQLELLEGDDGAPENFRLTAGSMHARLVDHAVRDQRGITRGSTSRVGTNYLVTPITHEDESDLSGIAAQLWSALESVALHVPHAAWRLWFRDLPLETDETGLRFQRPVNDPQREDINQPQAAGRARAWRSSYEWRLSDGAAVDAASTERDDPHLTLLGLQVYPLTLESLTVASSVCNAVSITARLQLPILATDGSLPKAREQTHRENVVRLVFARDVAAGVDAPITLQTIEPITRIVWPLEVERPRTSSDATAARPAQLSWSKCTYNPLTPSLAITEGVLEFEIFGAAAQQALRNQPIVLTPSGTTPVDWSFLRAGPASFTRLALDLWPAPGPGAQPGAAPTVFVDAQFVWGSKEHPRLRVLRRTAVVGTSSALPSAELVYGKDGAHTATLMTLEAIAFARDNVHVNWSGFTDANPALLPGWDIVGDESSGWAAMWFTVEARPGALPQISTSGAFAESILVSRWGAWLVDALPQAGAPLPSAYEAAFRSSAGRIHLDWVIAGENACTSWRTDYLVNGLIEVKNLVSWPEPLGLVTQTWVADSYPTGESKVPASAGRIVSEVASALRLDHDAAVTIEGHVDFDEIASGASDVGLERAHALSDAIRHVYDHPQRDQVLSRGASAPLPRMEGESDKVYGARCRRVVLTLRARVTLPASNASVQDLTHTRHALRILLQQQRIPSDIAHVGTDTLLVVDDRLWQFVAVTEHLLARVRAEKRGTQLTVTAIEPMARWSAVQEVRIGGTASFRDLLKNTIPSVESPGPDSIAKRERLTEYGLAWQAETVRSRLLQPGGVDDPGLSMSLLVEASVPLMLTARPGVALEGSRWFTTQFLPDGLLQAQLAAAEDFNAHGGVAPDDARHGRTPWSFLALPFLGRLQPQNQDGLTAASVPDGTIRVDPLLVIARANAATSVATDARVMLALQLACRAWNASATIHVPEIDLRRSARLDAVTSRVALSRVLHPMRGDAAEREPSPVMAVDVDSSPVIAASPFALQVAFLPVHDDGGDVSLPPWASPLADAKMSWRPSSLLAFHSVTYPRSDFAPFAVAAAQIASAIGNVASETSFAAATLLPSALERLDTRTANPMSFALSPFRRLAVTVMAGKTTPVLEFAELMVPGVGPTGATNDILCRIGTRAWRRMTADDLAPDWSRWAEELCASDAPDATFAIVRIRELRAHAADIESAIARLPDAVVIGHRFLVVTVGKALPRATQPLAPLRAAPAVLHFREGQFGGSDTPQKALGPVEAAPPQVDGVQPVWTLNAPSDRTSDDKRHRYVSALRFSVVQYDRSTDTPGGPTGIVAAPRAASGYSVVWWGTVSRHVQWSPGGDRHPELPLAFRARAIGSFLPAPAGVPLPLVPQAADDRWRALLPHAMRVVDVGLRPGVPMIFRHGVVTQREGSATGVAAGALVVQHRTPRPVPLPPNIGDPHEDFRAVSAWHRSEQASVACTAPRDTVVRIPKSPKDDPPHALTFTVWPRVPSAPEPKPDDADCARQLGAQWRLRGGVIPQDGAGELELDVEIQEFANGQWTKPPAISGKITWSMHAELRAEFPGGSARALELLACPIGRLASRAYLLRPTNSGGLSWREWIGDAPHGSMITLILVISGTPTSGQIVVQQRRFPLVVCRPRESIAPVPPAFVSFEDPEYSRRLASAPKQLGCDIVVAVDGNPTKLPGTFAADRHEYDRLSEVIVALQIDSFKDATAVKRAPRWIQLERVDRFGTRTTLTTAGNEGPFFTPGGAPDPEPILIGKLTYDPLRISLSKYDIRAGDTLRLKVVDQDVGGDTIDGAALEVPIVAKPVIPVPEAAYALLRSESDDRTAVSCARFAWSPQATRIDLLDPAQLFSSLVERRAVFQWNAAFAFDRANAWAVQKTTFQGSTYIPQLIAAENGG